MLAQVYYKQVQMSIDFCGIWQNFCGYCHDSCRNGREEHRTDGFCAGECADGSGSGKDLADVIHL